MRLLCLWGGLFLFLLQTQAQPIASFTYSLKNGGCEPDSAFFTNNSSGATSYHWDFGTWSADDTSTVTHPDFEYLYDGTYVVTLTAYDGSGDSSVTAQTLVIRSPGTIYFTNVTPNPVCVGEAVRFSINYSNGSHVRWHFGDGDTSTTIRPTHTYSAVDTYTVTAIAANSCGADTTTMSVQVNNSASPSPTFSVSPSTTVCPGQTIDFQNNSSNLNHDFTWLFGDGAQDSTVSTFHSYASTGSYTARLIATNNCGSDTTSQTINVTNSLSPAATIFSPNPAETRCPGTSFSFSGSTNSVSSWVWDFGDGSYSTQQYPDHAYSTTGTYKVYLTTENDCGNTARDSVTISVGNSVTPNAYISVTPSNKVCPGDTLHFSSSHSNGEWDLGDGNTATGEDVQHAYNTPGNYSVQLIVTNQCGNKDTTTKSIQVGYYPPNASASIKPWDHNGCAGDTFTYSTSSQGMKSVLWEFGDGDTSQQFQTTHVYSSTGQYTVMLTKTNSCGQKGYDAQTLTVTQGDLPTAQSFSSYPTLPCRGESINFNPPGFNDPNSEYLWKFGDGNTSTSQNASHIYTSAGTYQVQLIVTNSCGSDTAAQPIHIKPGAIPGFNAPAVCKGDSTVFTNMTSGSPAAYFWDFGDGDTSTQANPIHTYSETGNYEVTLAVLQNGCRQTTTQMVAVDSPVAPNAGFGYLINGNKVTFGDTSENASSRVWYFGDGDTSHQQYTSHTYNSGSYTVKLVVKNACGYSDTASHTFTFAGIKHHQAQPLRIYPNPSRSQVTLWFTTSQPGEVSLHLYNIIGQEVMKEQQYRTAGEHQMTFPVDQFSPGVYFLQVQAANHQQTRKLIISR